jgi:putative addiction module killer protein
MPATWCASTTPCGRSSTAKATDDIPQEIGQAQRGVDGIIYATIAADGRPARISRPNRQQPFSKWFDKLNAEAAQKVTTALYRMGLGNFSNSKSVGGGVHECRINFGPGYRVYFAKDGEIIVILLGGGTKQRQEHDIRLALERWEDYKRRKREHKGE